MMSSNAAKAREKRLEIEFGILYDEFDEDMISSCTDKEVRIKYFSQLSKTIFVISVQIPDSFPSSQPRIFVISPPELCLKDEPFGSLLNCSSSTHTLGGSAEFPQVCCSSDWNPESDSIFSFAIKGLLWVEALSMNWEYGIPIDQSLLHMGGESEGLYDYFENKKVSFKIIIL